MLNEQMRYANDSQYFAGLVRARSGSLTRFEALHLLNQRVVLSLFDPPLDNNVAVAKRNKLSHLIGTIKGRREFRGHTVSKPKISLSLTR